MIDHTIALASTAMVVAKEVPFIFRKYTSKEPAFFHIMSEKDFFIKFYIEMSLQTDGSDLYSLYPDDDTHVAFNRGDIVFFWVPEESAEGEIDDIIANCL